MAPGGWPCYSGLLGTRKRSNKLLFIARICRNKFPSLQVISQSALPEVFFSSSGFLFILMVNVDFMGQNYAFYAQRIGLVKHQPASRLWMPHSLVQKKSINIPYSMVLLLTSLMFFSRPAGLVWFLCAAVRSGIR